MCPKKTVVACVLYCCAHFKQYDIDIYFLHTGESTHKNRLAKHRVDKHTGIPMRRMIHAMFIASGDCISFREIHALSS